RPPRRTHRRRGLVLLPRRRSIVATRTWNRGLEALGHGLAPGLEDLGLGLGLDLERLRLGLGLGLDLGWIQARLALAFLLDASHAHIDVNHRRRRDRQRPVAVRLANRDATHRRQVLLTLPGILPRAVVSGIGE